MTFTRPFLWTPVSLIVLVLECIKDKFHVGILNEIVQDILSHFLRRAKLASL